MVQPAKAAMAPKVKERKRRRSAACRCAIRGFIWADHDQIAKALTSQILRFRNLFAIDSGVIVSGVRLREDAKVMQENGAGQNSDFLNRLTAAGRFSAGRAGHLTLGVQLSSD